MDRNKMIAVKNRSASAVGYSLPEFHIRRQFTRREQKTIHYWELEALAQARGGLKLIEKYLVIRDEEARKLILPHVEQEYFYTESDIKYMLEKATLDQFLDFLDFAPTGAIDILEETAVKIEVRDVRKRDAILKKTGFNVTSVIEKENMKNDGDGEEVKVEDDSKPKRRVAAPGVKAAPVEEVKPRRSSAPELAHAEEKAEEVVEDAPIETEAPITKKIFVK